jgi:hypothetical protein
MINNQIRGAIRTTISGSTELLVAGEQFSIFVTIQNPFEVPIEILRVSAHLPTEFIDIDQRNLDLQAEELQEQLAEIETAGRSVGLPPSGLSPRKRKFNLGIKSIGIFGLDVNFTQPENFGPVVARDLEPRTSSAVTRVSLWPFSASIATTVKGRLKGQSATDRPESQENIKQLLKTQLEEERDRVKEALSATRQIKSPQKTLQGGNSTTRVFTLRTKKTILFKPASYKLRIEIEYQIEGARNLDTIEHTLPIKAALASMILGSLFGGLAGWFTSAGTAATYDFKTTVSLVVSLTLGFMAVVLFSRKKDVQPIIAVEDFWGGVALGFLVAYAGPKVLNGVIPLKPTGG